MTSGTVGDEHDPLTGDDGSWRPGRLPILLLGRDRAAAVSGWSRVCLIITLLAWVGAAVLMLGSWSYLDAKSGLPWFALPVAAAATAIPLGVAVDRALLAWCIAWVAAVLTGVAVQLHGRTPFSWHPAVFFMMVLVLYLVVLRHRRRIAGLAWASMVALVVSFFYPADRPASIIVVTIIAAVADQIRRRRELLSRLDAEQERAQAEAARRVVLLERTRIAREMHDVVAHHISLIAVRAESAPYRLQDRPDETGAELDAIASAAREALVEMRRLLVVLRSEESLSAQPQPGLADIADLVETARDAGLDTDANVEPGMVVPASVGLTAYRVVQEALSNARRHASGAPVRVALATQNGELAVTVLNGPGASLAVNPADGSTGLTGMRERVTIVGGSLVVEATDDGGFRVCARIPLAVGEEPAERLPETAR